MDWIPISERVPEKEGIYYVMHSRFMWPYEAYWFQNEKKFKFVGEKNKGPVYMTHWAIRRPEE